MKNVDRRDQQLPYISDAEVMEQQMNAETANLTTRHGKLSKITKKEQ